MAVFGNVLQPQLQEEQMFRSVPRLLTVAAFMALPLGIAADVSAQSFSGFTSGSGTARYPAPAKPSASSSTYSMDNPSCWSGCMVRDQSRRAPSDTSLRAGDLIDEGEASLRDGDRTSACKAFRKAQVLAGRTDDRAMKQYASGRVQEACSVEQG